MSKALAVLKLFFSLVSINSTESPSSVNSSTSGVTRAPTTIIERYSFTREAFVGRSFRIPLRQDILSDLLHGDITRFGFAMKTNNSGDIRPSSWVQFDSARREVYGFPLPGNTGTFPLRIIVSNSTGASLHEIIFALPVQAKLFDSSHEVSLKTGEKFLYINFMTSVSMRIDFVRKLARYCFNENPSAIWIKTFNRETRELTIVFVNIPYSPCLKDTYQELRSKLVEADANIKPQFQTAMTETFPIESVKFKFFGSCDPNMFGPEKPFEWGWLKHVIPIIMILGVVGIPVSISCYVNKRRRKRPVVEERRPRTLRRRNDDDRTGLTSHTVHFNNRYPSMLSVSNNSKEENIGNDEKAHGGKSNIPNGSLASRHLTVPNVVANRPRQGANSTNANTTKNKKNPFKFASKEERANFDVRAMWDDDDDAEQPPLNIPTYYTYKSKEDEEPSMFDAVLDMNFSDIAENISTKLKGVKSMLNIQGENDTTQEERPFENGNPGRSLSTKLKGLGKSMLNLSTAANESSMATRTSLDEPAVSTLSTKLRDFGKSMFNLSPNTQGESEKDLENFSEPPNATDQHFNDSDSFIYQPREYDNPRSKRQSYSETRRSYNSARQYYDRPRHSYDNSRRAYGGRRQSYDEARDEYSHGREGYNDPRRGYSDARQSYHEAREDLNQERQAYNYSGRSFYDAQQDQDFRTDITSEYLLSRSGNCRYSDTSEYELAQYNFQARRRSLNMGYQHGAQDHHDNYRQSPHFHGGLTRRRSSREHDFDEYPDSMFHATSEHSLKSEHEKSIFDTDYCDAEDDEEGIVKPTPLWNHSPVSAAQNSLGLRSFGLNDTKYQDYTNPHQYSNGPVRIPHSKSSNSVLGADSFSSQSTPDFWGDERYDGEPKRNQSSNLKNDFFSSFTKSVPDLRRGYSKGRIPNGTKPQSKSKENQKNSLLSGSLSLGEKPPVVFTLGDSDEEEYRQRHLQQQTHRQQQQEPEQKTSFVGLIKTGVSSILEPDGNVSKWFSGFQKSENPVT